MFFCARLMFEHEERGEAEKANRPAHCLEKKSVCEVCSTRAAVLEDLQYCRQLQ